MANETLTQAKRAKNDEFYTQYADIEKEMNAYLEYDSETFKDKVVLLPCDDPEWSNFTKYFAQNFERLGLKKLISTSYSASSKPSDVPYQPSLFEVEDERFDPEKTITNGKIFTLSRSKSNKVNIHDLKWKYLEGDGDFRSDEVKELRDSADIIITNPPFSLFREFLAWLVEANKKYAIIGNMNAITYKEVFPLIKENNLWLGATGNGSDMVFSVPEGSVISPADKKKAEKLGYEGNYTRLGNSCWFTCIDHGKRHQPIPLMTMEDNLRFNKRLQKIETSYQRYDNYDAIEVPVSSGIPSDYEGAMGVPISFLDKYSPEQFKIVGLTSGRDEFECRPTKRYKAPIQHNTNGSTTNGSKANTRATLTMDEVPDATYYTAENADKPLKIVYARILIESI
ncbi:adenine-specific methyltransferase EcoRI family protein [Vibrio parahaemolyticus]